MFNAYNLTYDDVLDCIDTADKGIKQFCPYNIDYVTNSSTNNGSTEMDTLHPVGSCGYTPMTVSIGTKSLKENMQQSRKVRDTDAVWAMQQIFHETAHVWQYSVGYMQKNPTDKIKAMARDRAIGICFPEYKRTSYTLDTSELFADAYAISQLNKFFKQKATDERFNNININAIVCEKEYQRRGKDFPELIKCNTLDKISDVYNHRLSILPYRKRFDIPNMLNLRQPSNNFIKFLNSDIQPKVIDTANGLEESQLLCEYIGKHHPSCFRSLPCIKDEYCKGSLPGLGEQITGRILGVKPQPWRELPNVHINDHQNDDDYEFK